MAAPALCNTSNLGHEAEISTLTANTMALAEESPGFVTLNRFMLTMSLLITFGCLVLWFALKDRFERTRVRPSALVVMLASGTLINILVDHLQVSAGIFFPCMLMAILLAHIVPLVAGAIAARMVMFYFLSVFSHEVASSALSKMSETGFAYDVFEESADPVASICRSEMEVNRLVLRMVIWAPVDEQRSTAERQKMLKALRFVTSRSGAFSLVASLVAPSMLVITTVVLGNLSVSKCVQCSSVISAVLITMIVLGIFMVTTSLIMWKRVRHLADPWGLREESMYLLVLALFAIIFFMLDTFLPDVSRSAYFVFIQLLTTILVSMVATCTVLQLWLGYQQTRARRKGSSVSSTTSQGLDEILADPTTAQAFEKHLVSELGIESLLFVRDAEAWKKTYFDIAPNARKARAKKMHATYIAPSGIYAINIPDFMMREISSKLSKEEEDIEQTLFDSALKEIKNLLQVGAVARFLDSPENRKQVMGARTKTMVAVRDMA